MVGGGKRASKIEIAARREFIEQILFLSAGLQPKSHEGKICALRRILLVGKRDIGEVATGLLYTEIGELKLETEVEDYRLRLALKGESNLFCRYPSILNRLGWQMSWLRTNYISFLYF